MTENSVAISITIRVSEREVKIENEIGIGDMEANKKRRKPLDELLRVERYGRVSERVQEMGSSLACMGTYRLAASQLSWLIKTPISHSAVQRMGWTTGNRIREGEEAERRRVFESGGQIESGKVKAQVLYGEADGIWE